MLSADTGTCMQSLPAASNMDNIPNTSQEWCSRPYRNLGSHTHTHTHTHRDREKERDLCSPLPLAVQRAVNGWIPTAHCPTAGSLLATTLSGEAVN